MNEFQLSRAVDFIKANQNPDGGWGYRRSRMSYVEPTGFCALALQTGGDKARAISGWVSQSLPQGIRRRRHQSRDPEGSWMAYAALLAFDALGAGTEEERLRDWILSFEDASSRFTKEDLAAVATLTDTMPRSRAGPGRLTRRAGSSRPRSSSSPSSAPAFP